MTSINAERTFLFLKRIKFNEIREKKDLTSKIIADSQFKGRRR